MNQTERKRAYESRSSEDLRGPGRSPSVRVLSFSVRDHQRSSEVSRGRRRENGIMTTPWSPASGQFDSSNAKSQQGKRTFSVSVPATKKYLHPNIKKVLSSHIDATLRRFLTVKHTTNILLFVALLVSTNRTDLSEGILCIGLYRTWTNRGRQRFARWQHQCHGDQKQLYNKRYTGTSLACFDSSTMSRQQR